MNLIPLLAVPSQTLATVLNGQNVQISVYLLNAGLGSIGTEPDASSTDVTADSTQYTADLDTTIAGAISSQLYIDVVSNGQSIISCRPLMLDIPVLINAQYQGFSGEFIIIDTEDDSQPVYTGLGSRWQLVYLSPADIALAA